MRRLLLLMAGLTGLVALGSPAGASAAEGACPNEALRAGLGSSALPDCRAYEMVSPVQKNSADVSAVPSRTRVAADGNAVQYVALGAFPGAQGTDVIGAEYLAQRGSDGWSTHGITPSQTPPSFPLWSSLYVGDFSTDLNRGVFFALSPLTQEDPNVVDVPNLYLRDDLLSGGAGHYRLLSGCPACSSPLSAPPFELIRRGLVTWAGASDDLSHVIFESNANLLPGAEGSDSKLYESVDGVTRLAGILPDSACGSPPCVAGASAAGRGAILRGPENSVGSQELTSDAISRDGSRIIFKALSGTLAGSLFLREDGVRSVQLNASERSPAEAPQPANFAGATPDASKIFFTTGEQLTDDDTGSGANLYEYAVDAPAGHHLTLISRGDVVGVSADGEYVYFTGEGELLPGQATVRGSRQLYVWHKGELRYIGAGENIVSNDAPWRASAVTVGQMTSQVRVSPDGKHFVFVTLSNHMAESLGYDNEDARCPRGDACLEVYEYSYDTDKVVCISCDADGAPPAGDAAIASLNEQDTTKFIPTQHLPHALNDDGNVFFDSPDPLVPQDTNGKFDVYEYFAASDSLRLISSGESSGDSHFEDATADGSDVFFVTNQRLVGADIDENADLYDARVDGGIAAQQGSAAVECSGDLCQGNAAEPPALSLPSSLTFAGAGNLPALAQAPVVKPKPKVKARKKAKAKKKRRARRHRKTGRASVSHKSHSAGR